MPSMTPARPGTTDLERALLLLDGAIHAIEHRTDRDAPNLYAAVLRSLRTSRDDLAGRHETLAWQDVDERKAMIA